MVREADVLTVMEEWLGPGFRESSSKWRFTCPNCHGERSLHVNPNKAHGPYICNACGQTGSALSRSKDYELQLIVPAHVKESEEFRNSIDQDLLTKVYSFLLSSASLSPYHTKYMLSRGIVPNFSTSPSPCSMLLRSSDFSIQKLLEKFSSKELQMCGLLNEEGKSSGVLSPNRIVIFYLSKQNNVLYIRSRAVGVTRGQRFLGPKNVPSRDLSWGWETVNDKTNYLIVTEGEIKAQAAKQLGFQCVGIPGMQNGHEALAKACKDNNINRVYVMFDTESGVTSYGTPKQIGINLSSRKLGSTLKKYGITPFYSNLPLLGETKMDIDKFVLMKGKEAKTELQKILQESKEC